MVYHSQSPRKLQNSGYHSRHIDLVGSTGDLRFRLPVPVDPYNTSQTVTSYGDSCPQQEVTLPAPFIDGTLPVEIVDEVVNVLFDAILPNSEDCLTINVITPANATANSKLPVAAVRSL